MADSSHAIILAAILVSTGFHLFTRPYQKSSSSCNCTTVASLIFLTSVFAVLSVQNLSWFQCKLPARVSFLYEFLVSMFILEMALRLFWEPLECFLSTTLPTMCDEYLGGECAMFGMVCAGEKIVFVTLAYVLASGSLWAVLRGYGVLCGLFPTSSST